MDRLPWMHPATYWFALGMLLLLAEFAAPGLVVFFFGIGAMIVGAVCVFADVSLNAQIGLFIVGSLTMFLSLRRSMANVFQGRGTDSDGSDVEEVLGETATVIEPISADKVGRVEFRGTQWTATAQHPIDRGRSVQIVGRDSLTLQVKEVHSV